MPSPIEEAVRLGVRGLDVTRLSTGGGRMVARRAVNKIVRQLRVLPTRADLRGALDRFGVPYKVQELYGDLSQTAKAFRRRQALERLSADESIPEDMFQPASWDEPGDYMYAVGFEARFPGERRYGWHRFVVYSDERLSYNDAMERALDAWRATYDINREARTRRMFVADAYTRE